MTTASPGVLYVHDDLSDELAARGERSAEFELGQSLLALLGRLTDRVVILTLAQQIEAVVAQGAYPAFAMAVGIGAAGTRVAEQLHRRAGWFPNIRRIDVWREEDGDGRYTLAGPAPLTAQLHPLPPDTPSLAIVDDTIFSGITMSGVLTALPPALRARTHAFCLRAVAASVKDVARLATVTAGFAAPGRILDDVSFINASGLVKRGAIRRAGQPPLAFFERPEWIEAWFPGIHEDVIALCRALNARLSA